MDKRISMGKLLYVFGYDINLWKGDGKLLITYVSTKEKEKQKRYNSKLHCGKKKKNQKNENQRST